MGSSVIGHPFICHTVVCFQSCWLAALGWVQWWWRRGWGRYKISVHDSYLRLILARFARQPQMNRGFFQFLFFSFLLEQKIELNTLVKTLSSLQWQLHKASFNPLPINGWSFAICTLTTPSIITSLLAFSHLWLVPRPLNHPVIKSFVSEANASVKPSF